MNNLCDVVRIWLEAVGKQEIIDPAHIPDSVGLKEISRIENCDTYQNFVQTVFPKFENESPILAASLSLVYAAFSTQCECVRLRENVMCHLETDVQIGIQEFLKYFAGVEFSEVDSDLVVTAATLVPSVKISSMDCGNGTPSRIAMSPETESPLQRFFQTPRRKESKNRRWNCQFCGNGERIKQMQAQMEDDETERNLLIQSHNDVKSVVIDLEKKLQREITRNENLAANSLLLEKELTEKDGIIKTLEEKSQDYLRNVSILQDDLHYSQKCLSETTDRSTVFENENIDLKSMLKELEVNHEILVRDFDAISLQNKYLTEEIHEKKSAYAELEENYKALQSTVSSLEQMDHSVTVSETLGEQLLTDARREIAELLEKLETAQLKKRQSEEKLSEQNLTIQNLIAEEKSLQILVKSLEEKNSGNLLLLDQSNKNATKLETQLKNSTAEIATRVQELTMVAAELKNLEAILQEKNQNFEKAQKENEIMQEKLQESLNTNSSLEKHVENLKSKIQNHIQEINTTSTNLSKIREENAILNLEKNELNEKISKFVTTTKDLKKEVKNLSKYKKNSENTVAELKNEIARLHEQNISLDSQKNEIQKVITEKEAFIEKQFTEFNNIEEKCKIMESDKQNAENQIETLEQNLKKSDQKFSELVTEFQCLDKKNKETNNDFKELSDKFETIMREKNKLKEIYAETVKQLQDLQENHKTSTSEIQFLNNVVNENKTLIKTYSTDLNKKLTELENLTLKLNNCEILVENYSTDLAATRLELESSIQNLSEKTSRLSNLESENSKLVAEISKLGCEKLEQISVLKTIISEKENAVDKLKLELDSQKMDNNDSEKLLQAQIDSLTEELTAANINFNNETKQLKFVLETFQNELTEKSSNLLRAEEEKQKLVDNVVKIEQLYEESQAESVSNQTLLKKTIQEKTKISEQLNETEKQLAGNKLLVDRLNQELESITAELATTRSEFSKLQTELTEKSSNLLQAEEEKQKLLDNIVKIEQLYEESQAELVSNQTLLKKTIQEKTEISEQIKETEKQLAGNKLLVDRLNQELESITAELATTRSEFSKLQTELTEKSSNLLQAEEEKQKLLDNIVKIEQLYEESQAESVSNQALLKKTTEEKATISEQLNETEKQLDGNKLLVDRLNQELETFTAELATTRSEFSNNESAFKSEISKLQTELTEKSSNLLQAEEEKQKLLDNIVKIEQLYEESQAESVSNQTLLKKTIQEKTKISEQLNETEKQLAGNKLLVDRLNQELESITAELATTRSEFSKLQTELTEKSSNLLQAEEEKQKLLDNIVKIEQLYEESQAESVSNQTLLKKTTEEKTKISEQLNETEKQLAGNKLLVDRLNQELETITAELETTRSEFSNNESEFKSEISKLQTKLTEKSSNLLQAEEENKKLLDNIIKIEQLYEESQAESVSNQTLLKKTTEEKATISEQLNETEKQLDGNKLLIDRLNQELETITAELATTRSEFSNNESEFKSNIQKLETDLTEANSKLSAAQNMNTKLTEKITNVEQKFNAEIQQLVDENSKIGNLLPTQSAEISRLRTQIQKMETHLDQLKADYQIKSTNFENSQKELNTLKLHLIEKSTEVSTLTEENLKLAENIENLMQKLKENQSILEQQAVESNREKMQLIAQLEVHQRESATALRNLEAKNLALDEVKNVAMAKVNELLASHGQVRRELDDLVANKSAQNTKLGLEVNEARSKCRDLASDLAQALEDVQVFKKYISELTRQHNDMLIIIDQKNSVIEEMKSHVKQLFPQLSDGTDNFKEMIEKLQASQNESVQKFLNVQSEFNQLRPVFDATKDKIKFWANPLIQKILDNLDTGNLQDLLDQFGTECDDIIFSDECVADVLNHAQDHFIKLLHKFVDVKKVCEARSQLQKNLEEDYQKIEERMLSLAEINGRLSTEIMKAKSLSSMELAMHESELTSLKATVSQLNQKIQELSISKKEIESAHQQTIDANTGLMNKLKSLSETLNKKSSTYSQFFDMICLKERVDKLLNGVKHRVPEMLTVISTLEQRRDSLATKLWDIGSNLEKTEQDMLSTMVNDFKDVLENLELIQTKKPNFDNLSDSLEEIAVPDKTFQIINLHEDTFSMPPRVAEKDDRVWTVSPPSKKKPPQKIQVKKERMANGESWVIPVGPAPVKPARKTETRPRSDSTSSTRSLPALPKQEIRKRQDSDLQVENQELKSVISDYERKRVREHQQYEESRLAMRQKYEKQLEHMKEEMKQLYNQEINKHKSEQSKMAEELKKKNEELWKQNAAYKEDIDDLRSQLWSLGDKLLLNEQTKKKEEDRDNLSKQFDRIALQSVDSWKSGMSDGPQSQHHFLSMPVEDEDEIFDNRCLEDLKTGRFSIHNGQDRKARLTELQLRNSLCLPHLKSSYPVETQFISPQACKENDMKTTLPFIGSESQSLTDSSDPSMTKSLLPNEKPKKKEQTSYKRPGPPTPSKNGRPSLSSGEVKLTPKRPLREQNQRGTPSRLKALFTSKTAKRESLGGHDENVAPSTPRGKGLRIFQRKPFGGRDF